MTRHKFSSSSYYVCRADSVSVQRREAGVDVVVVQAFKTDVIACKEINVLSRDCVPLTALSNSISEKNLYQGSFSKSTSSGLTSWVLRHGNKRRRKKTKRRQFRQTSTDCTHPGNETIIAADWARITVVAPFEEFTCRIPFTKKTMLEEWCYFYTDRMKAWKALTQDK